jgi:hypothetical protein
VWRQAAKTRTSTGFPAATPSMLPEQETGCLIQFGEIRLTQWPLAIVARPEAPPLSRWPAPLQRTDQVKLSGSRAGSVTTSRNESAARTLLKRVSSVAAGATLCLTISLPYVSAPAGAELSATQADEAAVSARSRCLFGDIVGFRLVEGGLR